MNCEICKKQFTGIESFQQHEVSEKHRKKLLQHNNSMLTRFEGASASTPKIEKMNPSTFPCTTCKVTFQSLPDFIEHTGSSEHASALSVPVNPTSYPCTTCAITCHTLSEFIEHTGSKEHASALSIPVKPTTFPCTTCAITFQTLSEFIAHTGSKDHVAASSIPVNTTAYPCTTCAIAFQTLPDFIAHTGSKDHALMVLQENSSNIENCDSSSDMFCKPDLLMGASKATPSWLPRCETCGKNFSGPEPYQQHIESFDHKKKCGLLSPVQMPDKAPLATYCSLSCEPCGVTLSGPIPYQDHIRSIKHKKKVLASSNRPSNISKEIVAASEPKDLKCEVCEETFSEFPLYTQHLDSSAHKEAARNKFLNKPTGKENNFKSDVELPQKTSCLVPSFAYYCDICDVHCTGIDPFKAHMNGRQHSKMMVRKNADSNRSSVQSLLSGQASSFESSVQASNPARTEIDGRNVSGNAAMGDLGAEVKKSLYGEDWDTKTITPSNLDLTFFDVGEAIDFNKNSKIKIEVKDLDMIDIKEEEEDDKMDDE